MMNRTEMNRPSRIEPSAHKILLLCCLTAGGLASCDFPPTEDDRDFEEDDGTGDDSRNTDEEGDGDTDGDKDSASDADSDSDFPPCTVVIETAEMPFPLTATGTCHPLATADCEGGAVPAELVDDTGCTADQVCCIDTDQCQAIGMGMTRCRQGGCAEGEQGFPFGCPDYGYCCAAFSLSQ